MDDIHILVLADNVKDGGDIGAAIFLVADVMNRFDLSDAFLGGARAGP